MQPIERLRESVPASEIRPVVKDGLGSLATLLTEAVDDRVFPGAVLLVGRRGEILCHIAAGTRAGTRDDSPAGAVTLGMVFDVAALTEVAVSTTLLMLLIGNRRVSLDDKVSRYLQGFGVHGKGDITVRHLLGHTSGLPNWIPFFEELVELNTGARAGILATRAAKEYVYRSIAQLRIRNAPGEKRVYSDVGFILLGQLVEVLTGLRLDQAAQRYVFQPLGMSSSSFIDLSLIKRRGIHPVAELIAPTEECSWRKRVLCGEVHDDNAWAMGGVAGHSGLFTTALDLHRLASKLLQSHSRSDNSSETPYLSPDILAAFWGGATNGERCAPLGWEHPSDENALGDSKLGAHWVGCNGFTGCSLWIDPQSGVDIILVSNRIYPSRSNKKIQNFRAALHNAVCGLI